ncbi:Arm DNA-binding domain-containing protein [Caldimonas sp. KR1-144]|uniref:Arm DNA-binding domain-containing protein n=1 Tax=Caldimonas sp. KR1-144 TaxID=3400911 RepID=UPI003C0AFEC2
MGRTGSGVEIRDRSIRLSFTFEGKLRRETIRTDGEPVAPTPANIKYAHRLAAEIKDKIRHGTFSYADYFPASQHATTGHGTTVADQLDLWIGLQTGKESSTLKGYNVAARWWKARIGGLPLKSLKHSAILAALATEPTWSGKTRNNKVSVLRQALALALRDGAMTADPLAGLDAAKHQRPPPDPFSLDEAEAIVAELFKRYDPQIGNYFEAKFFTGMRTSESLAVRWESIDWRLQQMLVAEAIVLGEHKDRTKTHVARVVQLNTRALAALERQKAATFLLKDGWVFMDPRTRERWVDDEGPRENFWRPTLKRLGIRYRSPYETRHTYATMMLMAGMTPAFCAKQLGHSVEQFLRTYAKWIDGGRNDVEMGKLEGLISSPILPRASNSNG